MYNERSPGPIREASALRDRAQAGLLFWRAMILIISGFHVTIFGGFVKSQITNELEFNRLVAEFVIKLGRTNDSVSGFVTQGLSSIFKDNDLAGGRILIENPRVEFNKIGPRKFSRVIGVVLMCVDSTSHEFYISFRDTISARDISEVRESGFLNLRGEDPRWKSKYFFPFIVIGTGIAVIISLFYLRS